MTVDHRAAAAEQIEKLLSVHDLAETLGVPEATIYRWRSDGTGPPGIRVGKYVRWRPDDVRKWLASRVDPQPAA